MASAVARAMARQAEDAEVQQVLETAASGGQALKPAPPATRRAAPEPGAQRNRLAAITMRMASDVPS
jgi:hypothetical protein